MSAISPFSKLLSSGQIKLTKEELALLEAELFLRMYEELMNYFKDEYHNYLTLLGYTRNEENEMLDAKFFNLLLKDILSTGDYTVQGIARYTDIHEDILHEVIEGRNTNPSVLICRRIIDLHRTVRNELYNSLIKKITIDMISSEKLAS